jgi:hypothetical protein
MKIRLTTLIAVATGYYFGAKGGEQRYNQILWISRTVANSKAFRNLVDRLKNLFGSVVEALTGERPEPLSVAGQGQQGQQS